MNRCRFTANFTVASTIALMALAHSIHPLLADPLVSAPNTVGAPYVFTRAIAIEKGAFKILYGPSALTLDKFGNVYVVSEGDGTISKFSPQGKLLLQFGEYGSLANQLKQPEGVAVDDEGSIYVADLGNFRIAKFDKTGKYLLGFGREGHGDGEFEFITGLALDSHGNVYVADMGNKRVSKFSPTGDLIAPNFISRGISPTFAIAIDHQDNIYIAAAGIFQFDSDGHFLKNLGLVATTLRGADTHRGIAVDSSGRIFVRDLTFQTGLNNILIYSPSGELLNSFPLKDENGPVKSSGGIVVNIKGTLFVTEGLANRIALFKAPVTN